MKAREGIISKYCGSFSALNKTNDVTILVVFVYVLQNIEIEKDARFCESPLVLYLDLEEGYFCDITR